MSECVQVAWIVIVAIWTAACFFYAGWSIGNRQNGSGRR